MSDLISQGAIGKPQGMTLVRGSGLDGKSVLKAQANAMENGGGCLLDYGSHGMAGVWSVIGRNYRPVQVEAVSIGVLFRHRVLEDEPYIMEVDDNSRIKVLFQDEETGSWVNVFFEATWCGGHIGLAKENRRFYLQIVGDTGVIETSRGSHLTILKYDGGVTELPLREFPGESISMCDEIETFIDHVRAGTVPEIDIHFGSDIIAICGAAYLSAIRKKVVSLEEFREFSREYLKKHGDSEKADDAIVMDLLEPYRYRS
jgi:predicted dehydrogenase